MTGSGQLSSSGSGSYGPSPGQGRGAGSGAQAQEVSSRVWEVLQEGLQPYMQWELQQGLGDLWTKVCPSSMFPTAN